MSVDHAPGLPGDTLEPDDESGRVVAGRYLLESVIGAGGMATVYRATDRVLGRTVAVKAFRPGVTGADDARRQQGEVRVLAELNHPALVTLHDAVTDGGGRTFLVLEHVQGGDLRTLLARGPLHPARTAVLGAALAAGLAHVHAHRIVHRDVKPANVLLPDDASTGSVAKLSDFGIARLVDGSRTTATGSVLGTASYLSPEQAVGGEVTPKSDVYSLGLVLLECLTGERAFDGTPVEAAAARLSRDPSVPDELSRAWRGLLHGMTERDPRMRPDAHEVSARLRELAIGDAEPTQRFAAFDEATAPIVPVTAPVTRPAPHDEAPDATGDTAARAETAPPARRHRRRRRVLVITAIAVPVLALGGVFAASWLPTTPPDAPTPTYPAVEGELGLHLEQLQSSVTP